MEDCARRGRRRRGHSRPTIPYVNCGNIVPNYRPWSFINSLCNLMIMSSLMALIYLMLEYHCTTCTAKCNTTNMNVISKNIDHIAKNLSLIKQSYQDLELKLTKYSQELPKIEGQIEVLEALANTMESKDVGWNPKQHVTLPNVDVYLCKVDHGKNISQKSTKRFTKTTNVGSN